MHQYIPRVSRRRITGMSNTIHTFMHALQVPLESEVGVQPRICKSYAAPRRFSEKALDGAISTRVEGGNKHHWPKGSEEMSSSKVS